MRKHNDFSAVGGGLRRGCILIRNRDWVGLGWVGLGWVGLGWVGLGWVGLGWVGWLVGCYCCCCWSCRGCHPKNLEKLDGVGGEGAAPRCCGCHCSGCHPIPPPSFLFLPLPSFLASKTWLYQILVFTDKASFFLPSPWLAGVLASLVPSFIPSFLLHSPLPSFPPFCITFWCIFFGCKFIFFSMHIYLFLMPLPHGPGTHRKVLTGWSTDQCI